MGTDISNASAGALNVLTFGLSNKIAGVDGSCAGPGYDIGGVLGTGAFFFDGEAEAKLAVTAAKEGEAVVSTTEAADEATSVVSKVRAGPGGDGAESVIIKERSPSCSTVQVVHQVGSPLPGGGVLIIHQHNKIGPLPGANLSFPDVNP